MSNVISNDFFLTSVCPTQHLVELLPFSLVLFFVFSYTLTSSSQHQTNVAFGADNSNLRVNYRLLESQIPQFLIPFRHPVPTSTFIPIPSAKVHVAPIHRNISSSVPRTYMALHCCESLVLFSNTKTKIYT